MIAVLVAIDAADRSYCCYWVRAFERLHASVEMVHDVCHVALSIALLGRFEMRVCALALSLVRRRALQFAAVSVAAVVGRVCRRAKKGWRRA